MYCLLKRAKKNVGDFLIGSRAQALIEHVKPDHELVELKAWERLDDHLDTLNKASAIIICGGPGIGVHTYPGIYPLVEPLTRIKAPLVMLGSGWWGDPGDEETVQTAQFTDATKQLFGWILEQGGRLGVRDYLTQRVLEQSGHRPVTMTGCPAWYHVPSLGRAMTRPTRIEQVVFTPPRSSRYQEQCQALMAGLRRWLPDATLYCSFHRGLGPDDFTSAAEADFNQRLLGFATRLDYEVRDVSFDLDKIAFYDSCDLHVGYRVHAHLDFHSRRRPSVLLAEDSRGRGACEALGMQAFAAWKRSPYEAVLRHAPGRFGNRWRQRHGQSSGDARVVDQVLHYLREEAEGDFRRLQLAGPVIDHAYEQSMLPFLEALPE